VTRRDYRLGRVDLTTRAEMVDHELGRQNLQVRTGQDHRTGAEYQADLDREAEVSLMRSASWRAGKPLDDHRAECDCERTLAGCVERRPTAYSSELPKQPSPSRRTYGAERDRQYRQRQRQRNGLQP
jgi:thioesterase domain-containing protein